MNGDLQERLNMLRPLLESTGCSEEQVVDLLRGFHGEPGTGPERVERYLRFRFGSKQEMDAAAARVWLYP